MKIRRYKKVHKFLGFYENNFGFRQPYQILVDGTFCCAALQNKINIADNIPRYLQGEVKLLTTPCAIIEMENLGVKVTPALIILKKFAVHKCGHDKHPVTASKCFLSMVKNKNENHYMIATQDRDLEEKIRKIIGVPLLYLHMKTPVLEQPSEATQIYAKEKLSKIGTLDKNTLQGLKEKSGIVEEDKIIKKKRKKGPNPLSCKKKKKKTITGVVKNNGQSSEVKKRRKIRMAKHVKEEIFKNKVHI